MLHIRILAFSVLALSVYSVAFAQSGRPQSGGSLEEMNRSAQSELSPYAAKALRNCQIKHDGKISAAAAALGVECFEYEYNKISLNKLNTLSLHYLVFEIEACIRIAHSTEEQLKQGEVTRKIVSDLFGQNGLNRDVDLNKMKAEAAPRNPSVEGYQCFVRVFGALAGS